MRKDKMGFVIGLSLAALVAAGAGVWWWRASSQRADRIAEANRIISNTNDPSIEGLPYELRLKRAVNEVAADLHRSPDWLKQDFEAGLEESVGRAKDASPEEKSLRWQEAGDLAFVLGHTEKAGEFYRNAVASEPKDQQSKSWMSATSKFALYLHVTAKYEAEYGLRKKLAEVLSPANDDRYANALIRLVYAEQCVHPTHPTGDFREPLTRAKNITERIFGADSAELIGALDVLAGNYNRASQFDDSEKLLQQALAISEKRFGLNHWRTAFQLYLLGGLYNQRARWSDGEDYCRRALETCDKAGSDGEVCRALSWYVLGRILESSHKFAEAEAAERRALEADEKNLGPASYYVGADLIELARVSGDQSHYAEAEAYYRRATNVMEATVGIDSADFANCIGGFASMVSITRPPAEAEPTIRRMEAIMERVFGPKSARAADARIILGKVLEKMGRHEEAKNLTDQGTRALIASKADLVPGAIVSKYPMVEALISRAEEAYKSGDLLEAEKLMRKALAQAESTPSPDEEEIALVKNNLAFVLQYSGQYTEAESLYRWCLEINTRKLGPKNAEVGDNLVNLAVLNQMRNRPKDALPLAQRALEIYRASYASDNERIGKTLSNLAAILKDLHRLDEAEPMAREALAIGEKNFGMESQELIIRLDRLGEILDQAKRFREAEPVLRRLLILVAKHAPANPAVMKPAKRYVQNYEQCLSALGVSEAVMKERFDHLSRGENVPDL